MPKGAQPVRINSATLGSQAIQPTQPTPTPTPSRTTGPKSILKNAKGKALDPASELLHQKKTTPREVPPFQKEKEEDSLTKLRRLHEKNVSTTAVKKLTGKPMFGVGGDEKRGHAFATDDSSSDDDIPSLKRVIASTSSNAIRTSLTKRYGILVDDEESPDLPPPPTGAVLGTSRAMSPDQDDEEMDIEAWLDREMGKNGQSLSDILEDLDADMEILAPAVSRPPSPALPAFSSSPPLERPTKRKKYQKDQDQNDARDSCPPLFKGKAPFYSFPAKVDSEDWNMFDMQNTRMEYGEMLPMTEMEKMPSQFEGDDSGTMDIMDILGDCVVFEDELYG